ncbi:MAG TPA: hypothetical protein PKD15_00885 [Candidatus Saccharibacteria bacterium]|nr:hypothetical protein [Candidatus Saccharibacteria bacterium]
MAKRRMFSVDIVQSDVFLDMPLSSQALYFHLCMNADDDGFVSPKRVMRMVGANQDDLNILIAKRYVLSFDSGVAVVKHWHINNTIRKDRSIPTTYKKEFGQLTFNEFRAYTERRTIFSPLIKNQQSKELNAPKKPIAGKMAPQNRIEENRIDINTTNVVLAKKSPVSEISVLYYQVVKKLRLPVRNHNNVKAVIKKMEAEGIDDQNVAYLTFMLDSYTEWQHRYKPSITEALDIYAKRNRIVEKFNPSKISRGVKL